MNTQTELKVSDMVCGGCAGSIRKALGAVGGVGEIDVDVNSKTVMVRHDERLTRDEIVKLIDRAGFSAS